VIAFNDHSRVLAYGGGLESVGQNTADIFALVSSLYHADLAGVKISAPGIYDADLNKCDVRVRLAGQVRCPLQAA
jgi:hypothetical protein